VMTDEFDINNPENLGRPIYWRLDAHIAAIEQMIRADEIQEALRMCDNVPGWWRDHYPAELERIKNTLFRQCYDQFDYASDGDEAGWTKEDILAQAFSAYTYPRADILAGEVRALNNTAETPWIFEISPSHGWLPLGFADKGLQFTFCGKNLNQPALNKIKHWLPEGVWADQPLAVQKTMLVCFEALEHMWNPHDLEQAAKKIGVKFDYIFLSTPKYTLGGGLPDWDTRRLGHVRTWTPNEFLRFADESFRGYAWHYYDAHSLVLKGVKK
jgi:hypothetical protein